MSVAEGGAGTRALQPGVGASVSRRSWDFTGRETVCGSSLTFRGTGPDSRQRFAAKAAFSRSPSRTHRLVFGTARILEDPEEKRTALYSLIRKYFPEMEAGKEYRPITDKELKRTTVYAIEIESWSGKENWSDRADQSDEWPALGEEWFE